MRVIVKSMLGGTLSLFLFFAGAAQAITISTPVGSTTSGPVSAKAEFTFGAGVLSLDLTNLTVDPTDVAQNLSAIIFTLDGTIGTRSLTGSSALERTVNGEVKDKGKVVTASGAYTDGASVSTGWVFSGAGQTLMLDVLSGTGHAGPAHTLIGEPGTGSNYNNANGSIAGNKAHNAFLANIAQFDFALEGVTAETNVTRVIFQFGTAEGSNRIQVDIPQNEPPTPAPGVVPLPSAAYMGFVAFAGMCIARFSRRRV